MLGFEYSGCKMPEKFKWRGLQAAGCTDLERRRGLSCAYQCEATGTWIAVEDRGLAPGAQGQHVV